MTSPDTDRLTGRDDSHLSFRDGIGLTPACWAAFDALRADALAAGFELAIASGFRDFERQLAIFNAKASGSRPVHGEDGAELNVANLEDSARLAAILRFSALPGASRHHWGTDLDVFDAASLPPDYRVQLSPEEVAEDGIFGPLHAWLDARIAIPAVLILRRAPLCPRGAGLRAGHV